MSTFVKPGEGELRTRPESNSGSRLPDLSNTPSQALKKDDEDGHRNYI